jgi:hypothetical protein
MPGRYRVRAAGAGQVGPVHDRDLVVVRWRAEGTSTGVLPGTDPSAKGRAVVFYGTDTLRLQDGLIAEIAAVLAPRAVTAADAPDTGTLAGDVRAFVETTRRALSDPRVAPIVLDLFAESLRNPELAAALREHVTRPRRALVADMLDRARERNEVAAGVDTSAALDLLAGPFVVRTVVADGPMDDAWAESVAGLLLRALGASSTRRAPAG